MYHQSLSVLISHSWVKKSGELGRICGAAPCQNRMLLRVAFHNFVNELSALNANSLWGSAKRSDPTPNASASFFVRKILS
jgi:hypothetical protein